MIQLRIRGVCLVIAVTVGCDTREPVASVNQARTSVRDDPASSLSPPNEHVQSQVAWQDASPVEEIPMEANAEIEVDATALLRTAIRDSGVVAFNSSRLPTLEGDDGFRLTLLSAGEAKLRYYGDDGETVDGTYRFDPAGRLVLHFSDDDKWLPMPISVRAEVLLVNAPAKEEIIRMAVNAGIEREEITESDLRSAFEGWPLRQIIEFD